MRNANISQYLPPILDTTSQAYTADNDTEQADNPGPKLLHGKAGRGWQARVDQIERDLILLTHRDDQGDEDQPDICSTPSANRPRPAGFSNT